MMDLFNTVVATTLTFGAVALLVWLVGGLALRFVGSGWILFGAAIAIQGATGSTATAGSYVLALFNVAVGVTFWLCGHALYAARHRHWKSPPPPPRDGSAGDSPPRYGGCAQPPQRPRRTDTPVREVHMDSPTPRLVSFSMGTTRKRRGVDTKPFYADIRPEAKDKFDRIAEAVGVRKNVLFEEILAHVEVDERGVPTWWDRPLTSDQQGELRLTG